MQLGRLERPVARRAHDGAYPEIEVEAFGEAGHTDVGPGFGHLVVASVEVEGRDVEFCVQVVAVPDTGAGAPEGYRLAHEVTLPGRPAACCDPAGPPRGAWRGCPRGSRGPRRRSPRRRAGSRARGGERPP